MMRQLRFMVTSFAVAGLTLSLAVAVCVRPVSLSSCSRTAVAPNDPAERDTTGLSVTEVATTRRRSFRSHRGYRSLRERPARRVVSGDQVALGACRYFLAHSTLDMDALALSLSISRATLYRVVHSRDQLLGDVLWHCAERLLRQARQQRTETGIDGVLQVTRVFSAGLRDAEPFRNFLATEPETAIRVLFTPVGNVHRRAVELQKQIFAEATPAQGPWLTGDLDHLAYLYVRLFESTYYAELLAGIRPDWDLTERAARAVLSQAL